jgi:pilus assembly protein CpaB
MRKSGNIFLLAILIAALSAAMIYRYLREQQLALEQARNAALGSTVDVTVASETLTIGSRIEPYHVRIVRWPLDAEPEGAIHDVKKVVGRIARTTLQKNRPVVEADLISEGAGLLPLLITEGMRGMSVKVDKVTGVSGFVTPSSRVDVLVSGNVEGAGDQERELQSKLVLQNIKVLAIGTTIEQQDNEATEVPTVTLLLTPEDAEKLILAARQEPVHLALRNYRDEESVTTQGVTTRELFGRDGRSGARRPRAGPPPRPSVEVLLGEERTQQRF